MRAYSVTFLGLVLGIFAGGCGSDGGASPDAGTPDVGGSDGNASADTGTDAQPITDAGQDVVVVDSGIAQIATSSFHQLVLKSDGTVWAHGRNDLGQLGQGTTTLTELPTLTKVAGLPSTPAVGISTQTSFAIDGTGALFAWGRNDTGLGPKASIFGDGTIVNASTPKATGITDVAELASGDSWIVARKKDGTVWTWGYDFSGSLGPGASGSRLSPGQVPGLAGITQVAAGADFGFALKADKTIFSWGRNNRGQLGNGTSSLGYQAGTPGLVSGISDAVAVGASRAGGDTAAGANAFAIRSDGSVWGWGDAGNLGVDVAPANFITTPKKLPVLNNVTALAFGDFHVLALESDGTVWAWGSNVAGQIGDGTTDDAPVPKKVATLAGVVRIFAGGRASFAIKADGTVWAWGDNGYTQLGVTGGLQKTPVKASF